MLPKKCFCWDLKKALTIIAIVELILWSIFNFLFVCLLLMGFTFLNGNDFIPIEFWQELSLFLIATVFELVNTFCFFFGVRRGKKPLVLAVLVMQWIEIFFQVSFLVFMGYATQDLTTFIYLTVFAAIVLAYHLYIWLCNLSYYKSLSRRENNGATYSKVDAERVMITGNV